MGKRDVVAAECRELIRLSPANTPAHLDFADKLRKSGDRDLAVVVCRAVIELEPGNERAHHRLADLPRESGQLDQAVVEYRIPRGSPARGHSSAGGTSRRAIGGDKC